MASCALAGRAGDRACQTRVCTLEELERRLAEAAEHTRECDRAFVHSYGAVAGCPLDGLRPHRGRVVPAHLAKACTAAFKRLDQARNAERKAKEQLERATTSRRSSECGITSNEQTVFGGLERASSTRVGNLSLVHLEWLQGAAHPPPSPPSPPSPPAPPSPPSPPPSPQEGEGAAAVPSGEEWPTLRTSPTREHESTRTWPTQAQAAAAAAAAAAQQVPKINSADVQRMARVRNAGLIWDSLYTEVNVADSWVGNAKPQKAARSPLATVSVVCTI